jgi:hypothetical protein
LCGPSYCNGVGALISPEQALLYQHESPRITKLYDRTGDQVTLDEIKRIQI